MLNTYSALFDKNLSLFLAKISILWLEIAIIMDRSKVFANTEERVEIKIEVFMLIGVLSDTHLTDLGSCKILAEKLLSGPFSEIKAVLHAGDIVTSELESCFDPLPWYSVRGNMDHSLIAAPIRRVIELEQKRIGLIHGWGGHADLEQRVLASFADQQLDVLVYGHSHHPVCHWLESLLVMNPGSATFRRRAPHCTVGILTLGEQISGELIVVD